MKGADCDVEVKGIGYAIEVKGADIALRNITALYAAK